MLSLYILMNFLGRKTIAPGMRHKHYVRDAVIIKEFLPSPAKKTRAQLYKEKKKLLLSKPVQKVTEFLPSPAKKTRAQLYKEKKKLLLSKPVQKVTESITVKPLTIIEKKPVLNAVAVEEWRNQLPQRTVQKRKRVPSPQGLEKPAVDIKAMSSAEKPVTVDPELKETRAVPAEKVAEKDEKVPDLKPTAEPNEDGLYELDSVTSRILSDELQQIMIKVWQELPDSPPTEAERLVVKKFRNEAGDDLQNALGISVTSRLLNVYNPLYIKLHFSGKPEAGCLQAFIRHYRIGAFKRIADLKRDTFAARFDDVAAFDKMCAHSELNCGSATVTITPCYKYLSCPPSIKTIYGNAIKTKVAEKETTSNSTPQKQIDKTTEKTQTVIKNDAAETAVEKKLNTVTKDSEIKTQANKTATPVTNPKIAAIEKKLNTVTKDSEIKTPANKTAKPVTNPKIAAVEKKLNTVTKDSEIKTQANKTATPVTNPKIAAVEKKLNTVTKDSEIKTQANKTATPVTNPKIEATINNKATSLPEKGSESKEPKKNENKIAQTKNNLGDKSKNNDKQVKSDDNEEMTVADEMDKDYEEMTDQDILALMSSGIVLDECSGSDDENSSI